MWKRLSNSGINPKLHFFSPYYLVTNFPYIQETPINTFSLPLKLYLPTIFIHRLNVWQEGFARELLCLQFLTLTPCSKMLFSLHTYTRCLYWIRLGKLKVRLKLRSKAALPSRTPVAFWINIAGVTAMCLLWESVNTITQSRDTNPFKNKTNFKIGFPRF